MLLAEDFFKTFTTKPISDATKSTEVWCAFHARVATRLMNSLRMLSLPEDELRESRRTKASCMDAALKILTVTSGSDVHGAG
jgi:hypothetical protein